jgi:hypothetical protein
VKASHESLYSRSTCHFIFLEFLVQRSTLQSSHMHRTAVSATAAVIQVLALFAYVSRTNSFTSTSEFTTRWRRWLVIPQTCSERPVSHDRTHSSRFFTCEFFVTDTTERGLEPATLYPLQRTRGDELGSPM